MDEIRYIYEKWHQYAKERDVEALIALYADHGKSFGSGYLR